MWKKIIIVLLVVIVGVYGLWRISKSRTFQFTGLLFNRVEVSDSLVALTFDDGPTLEYTDEVLAVLDQNNVPATFFVTGAETERNLAEAQKIVTAGHQLGNHSYSHPQMVLKSPRFVRTELERTDSAIRSAGYTGEIYFRPPFCKKLFILPWILRRTDRTSITWDIEPESYGEVGSSAENIAAHIETNVRPGSIILLHVMYEARAETRKSLPIFIRRLKDRGYEFVTVSELIQSGTQWNVSVP